MKLAKHIMVARADGPEAGLAAYLATPIAKTHPQYGEITRKRTQKSRVATYCKLFAGPLSVPEEHIGRPVGRPRTKPAKSVEVVENPMEALFAQFQAFMQGQAVSTEVEDDDEDEWVSDGKGGFVTADKPARKTTTVRNKRVNMPATCITAGEAWESLNVNGDFPQPRDPGKPATNGQLYRLNVAGLLSIGR